MINLNHYLLTKYYKLLDDSKDEIINSINQIKICKNNLDYCLELEYSKTITKLNKLINLKNKIEACKKELPFVETINLNITNEPNYKSKSNLNNTIPFETHSGMCYMDCYYWNEFKDISYDTKKCRNELIDMYGNLNTINNIYTAIELHKYYIYKIVISTIETIDIDLFKLQFHNKYYRLRKAIIKILQKNISLNLINLIHLYQDYDI